MRAVRGPHFTTMKAEIMKTIRLLLFLVLSGAGFAPAAMSAEPLTASEQQLVGIWEEYSPSSNVVQFYPDRSMRIYLTQEEGAQMKLHWIEANWSVSPESMLTLNFSANGKSFSQSVKLVFEDKEMWLVDKEKNSTTKHHRITGEIPGKYRW